MLDTVNAQKRKKAIKLALRYTISTAIAITFALFIIRTENLTGVTSLAERYKILCDAFMLPGMFLIMIGLLVFVSSTGFFDIFAFSIGKALRLMIPALKYNKEKFYEYKLRKDEAGRAKGYSFLFIVGAAFTLIGVVFLILFYRVFEG